MTDFSKLLAKASSNADKFKQAIENESQAGFQKDPSYWQPTVDKLGNGFATIRFLPAPPQDGEDALPWVKYFSHGFKGPSGLWYIENSLTTLGGKEDPVSSYNAKLWATGTPENKKLVSERKRKLSYVSNIVVISDPANPDNNGKVFRFRYGKKLFQKIEEAMNPEKFDPAAKEEGKVGFDPFHLIDGANFKLKVRKVDGFPNYDKSEFAEPTPLLGGDLKKLEELWKSEYSLLEVIAPDKFKDYGTLKNRLDTVLGIDTNGGAAAALAAPAEARPVVSASTAETVSLGDDDDDNLFENLAKG